MAEGTEDGGCITKEEMDAADREERELLYAMTECPIEQVWHNIDAARHIASYPTRSYKEIDAVDDRVDVLEMMTFRALHDLRTRWDDWADLTAAKRAERAEPLAVPAELRDGDRQIVNDLNDALDALGRGWRILAVKAPS
jgi:hypothetical protein